MAKKKFQRNLVPEPMPVLVGDVFGLPECISNEEFAHKEIFNNWYDKQKAQKPRVRAYRPHAKDEPKVVRTQAARVVARFGGPRRLSYILQELSPQANITEEEIASWLLPTAHGLIPPDFMVLIWKACRLDGIYLTEEDMSPFPIARKEREWMDHIMACWPDWDDDFVLKREEAERILPEEWEEFRRSLAEPDTAQTDESIDGTGD